MAPEQIHWNSSSQTIIVYQSNSFSEKSTFSSPPFFQQRHLFTILQKIHPFEKSNWSLVEDSKLFFGVEFVGPPQGPSPDLLHSPRGFRLRLTGANSGGHSVNPMAERMFLFGALISLLGHFEKHLVVGLSWICGIPFFKISFRFCKKKKLRNDNETVSQLQTFFLHHERSRFEKNQETCQKI